jgi:hypothetical protein
MKKLTWMFLMLAGNVFAAGPYDGVYQYGLSSSFYSVHQNGSQLLVISLSQLPVSGGIQITVGPNTIVPTILSGWDYALGAVNGTRARISGTNLYGACVTTTDVAFENGVATATFVSASNTAFGTQQGVNCAQLLRDAANSVGGTITLRRIF